MTRTPLWLAAGAACAVALALALPRPRPETPVPDTFAEQSAECRAVAARAMAKLFLAGEVSRGRLTVPQAAAVFGWLNRQPPVAKSLPGGPLPEEDEADVLCRQVQTVRATAVRADDPAREGELVRRESAEVAAARGPDGRITLPPVCEGDCRELLRRAALADEVIGRTGWSDVAWLGDGLGPVVR
jgi:hypothetical protein